MIRRSNPGYIPSEYVSPVPEEPALQDWIEEAYKNMDYRCYNWHKKERVNENGVDMSCEATDGKVVLAVKIRPKKEDIKQLKKFAGAQADKRVYIYWSTPTKEFQEQLKLSKVDSLTGNALQDFLIEHASFGFLKWRFIRSQTLQSITTLISVIYDCESVPKRAFTKTDLVLLWRMKSAVVKVKSDARLTKNYFGDPILRETTPAAAARITNNAMEMVEMASSDASEFLGIITQAQKEAPHVLRRFLGRVSTRSGGNDLHYAVKKATKQERNAVIENWLIEGKEVHKFISAFSWLEQTLDNVEDRLSNLSQGVDWVFEEALSELWKFNAGDVSD